MELNDPWAILMWGLLAPLPGLQHPIRLDQSCADHRRGCTGDEE